MSMKVLYRSRINILNLYKEDVHPLFVTVLDVQNTTTRKSRQILKPGVANLNGMHSASNQFADVSKYNLMDWKYKLRQIFLRNDNRRGRIIRLLYYSDVDIKMIHQI